MLANCVPVVMSYLLPIIQERQGVELSDPVLTMIDAKDMSKYIFRILYTVLISTFVYLSAYPEELMVGFKMYLWISLLRICSVYLVPLEPPTGLIILEDPLLASLIYKGKIITKDLFFSGHTATIVSCGFTMHHKQLKKIIFAFALLLSYLLLVQHIHYTIDIVGAWIFCFLVYKILTADKKSMYESV